MPSKIVIPKDKVRDFCHRNHIQKFALFGSVLRDDFGSESDIDVLVEFKPGAGVGFFELYDMEKELSRMFGGRKVEITTPRSLSKYFRDSVLKNAEIQYARTWSNNSPAAHERLCEEGDNWLIHGYDAVDYDILWDAITNNFPPLLIELEKILSLEEQ